MLVVEDVDIYSLLILVDFPAVVLYSILDVESGKELLTVIEYLCHK